MGDGAAAARHRNVQIEQIGGRVRLLFGGGHAAPHAQNFGGQAAGVRAEHGIIERVAAGLRPFAEAEPTPFDAAQVGLLVGKNCGNRKQSEFVLRMRS